MEMKTGIVEPVDGGPNYYYCILDESRIYTDTFQKTSKWCDLQFGKRQIRHKPRWARNSNIFFFVNAEDALLFRLTWE